MEHNLAEVFVGANMNAIFKDAAAGDANAQKLLGYAYMLGAGGLARDDQQAARWFMQAAVQGNLESMQQLADLYAQPTANDWSEAIKWYERAARNGDAYSAYQAYLIYAGAGENKRVAKNFALARQYLARAAELGYEDARRQVGP